MVGNFQTQLYHTLLMNIFCLHDDAEIAAKYNCTIHTSKIFLEVCQMLTYIVPDDMLKFAPKTQTGEIRKKTKTHFNHPVSKFVRQNKGNMWWAIDHAYYLDEERIWRSHHTKKPHFSKTYLDWFVNHVDEFDISDGERTDFAIAINESCNCRKIASFDTASAIERYRLYYQHDKPFAKWGRRGVPEWYTK